MSSVTTYRASWTEDSTGETAGRLSTMWDAADDHAARADVARWTAEVYAPRIAYELVALDRTAEPSGDKVPIRKVPLALPAPQAPSFTDLPAAAFYTEGKTAPLFAPEDPSGTLALFDALEG